MDILDQINKRFDNLEFRQELGFKKANKRIPNSIDTLDDVAFDFNLTKEHYTKLVDYRNRLIESHAKINVYNKNDLSKFTTKEQFEKTIQEILNGMSMNDAFYQRLARVFGIYDLLYGRMAINIQGMLNQNKVEEEQIVSILERNKEATIFTIFKNIEKEVNINLVYSNQLVNWMEQNQYQSVINQNDEVSAIDTKQESHTISSEDHPLIKEQFRLESFETIQLVRVEMMNRHASNGQRVYNYVCRTSQGNAIRNIQELERVYQEMSTFNHLNRKSMNQIRRIHTRLQTIMLTLNEIIYSINDLQSKIK